MLSSVIHQGKYAAMVVCWLLGNGCLFSWNSMLTIEDYYVYLFPVFASIQYCNLSNMFHSPDTFVFIVLEWLLFKISMISEAFDGSKLPFKKLGLKRHVTNLSTRFCCNHDELGKIFWFSCKSIFSVKILQLGQLCRLVLLGRIPPWSLWCPAFSKSCTLDIMVKLVGHQNCSLLVLANFVSVHGLC